MRTGEARLSIANRIARMQILQLYRQSYAIELLHQSAMPEHVTVAASTDASFFTILPHRRADGDVYNQIAQIHVPVRRGATRSLSFSDCILSGHISQCTRNFCCDGQSRGRQNPQIRSTNKQNVGIGKRRSRERACLQLFHVACAAPSTAASIRGVDALGKTSEQRSRACDAAPSILADGRRQRGAMCDVRRLGQLYLPRDDIFGSLKHVYNVLQRHRPADCPRRGGARQRHSARAC